MGTLFRKKIDNVGTVPVCTDGKPMYRPEKGRLGYRHFDVIHNKKQFWKKHKETGLQVATQIIDRRWRALKARSYPNTKAAQFTEGHIFAASWLYEHGDLSERVLLREAISILKKRTPQ